MPAPGKCLLHNDHRGPWLAKYDLLYYGNDTWRRTVHGDHYVTGLVPGVGSDWGFM